MILILLVFAFVIFCIAGFWNPAPPSPWFGRLIAAGLAFYMAAEILIHYPGFGR
jgi:hypothetical protein